MVGGLAVDGRDLVRSLGADVLSSEAASEESGSYVVAGVGERMTQVAAASEREPSAFLRPHSSRATLIPTHHLTNLRHLLCLSQTTLHASSTATAILNTLSLLVFARRYASVL